MSHLRQEWQFGDWAERVSETGGGGATMTEREAAIPAPGPLKTDDATCFVAMPIALAG